MTKTTLTFDDIDTGSAGIDQVPNGYGNLAWNNFFALDVANNAAFAPGATSGQQVALNGGGGVAEVTFDGGIFTFKSVEMTAAYDSSLTVHIYGYSNGTQIYEKTVHLNDESAKLVQLNFKGVDDVQFVPGRGTHDPAQNGHGKEIAFDDMIVGNMIGVSSVGPSFASAGRAFASSAGDHHMPMMDGLHAAHPEALAIGHFAIV